MSDKIYYTCCGFKISVTRNQANGEKPFPECPHCHKIKNWRYVVEGAKEEFKKKDKKRFIKEL